MMLMKCMNFLKMLKYDIYIYKYLIIKIIKIK